MTNSEIVDLAIVVAVAENGTIGRHNELPWRLPEDLKFFKRVTLGHPIVMGRNTFESIGRPLPGRTNIVVTGNRQWRVDGIEVAHSLEDALAVGSQSARQMGVSSVMVIGGAEIYRQVLPFAKRLHITEVHAEVEGDAFFPELDKYQWSEIERISFDADNNNPYAYSFVTLIRKNAARLMHTQVAG